MLFQNHIKIAKASVIAVVCICITACSGSTDNSSAEKKADKEQKPNIVLIYADDIGYGDLSCYGAIKVKTPNCDSLAAQGIRFTDGHTVAACCTPSRYSMLTGEYAFRNPGAGIASGIEGMLIDTRCSTLPSMLKKAGYKTGVVGKWHLGLGVRPTNYNATIKPGPNDLGFDYAWILPSTGDRVPCVWVENDHVVNLDPADPIMLDYSVNRGEPDSYVNGIPRIGSQKGGKAALWKDDEMSFVIAEKSCAFIEKNNPSVSGKPFFLYMSTHNIHVPRVPNPMFVGKSDCGVRCDAIVEFDWMVGQVMDRLDKLGLTENTLVILSSDNGGKNDNNGPDKIHGIGDPDATNGHLQNGLLRGNKGTVYEGGTRVPFIVRWPERINAGVSDALISQVDLLASLAALTGQTIEEGQAPDSQNHMDALLGIDLKGRSWLLTQTNQSSPYGLRSGSWKYLPDGGDFRNPKKEIELFNLENDLAESNNLATKLPEKIKEMQEMMDEIINRN